jgi:hypothetical protein
VLFHEQKCFRKRKQSNAPLQKNIADDEYHEQSDARFEASTADCAVGENILFVCLFVVRKLPNKKQKRQKASVLSLTFPSRNRPSHFRHSDETSVVDE